MSRSLLWKIVLGALVLLLVASVFLSLKVLRRLPNSVIYFVRSEPTHFVLEPVYRQYPTTLESQLRAALEDLMAGPKASEKSKGLYSSVPVETNILSLTIENDTVYVDLSKEFTKEGGLADNQGRLYQVFYTLSQPQDIEQVKLSIEGQPLEVLGGEGLMVNNPWKRVDREHLPTW